MIVFKVLNSEIPNNLFYVQMKYVHLQNFNFQSFTIQLQGKFPENTMTVNKQPNLCTPEHCCYYCYY